MGSVRKRRKIFQYQLTDLGDLFLKDGERFTKIELLVVCLGGVEVGTERSSQGELGGSDTSGDKSLEILNHA